jgi:hypothetical protein
MGASERQKQPPTRDFDRRPAEPRGAPTPQTWGHGEAAHLRAGTSQERIPRDMPLPALVSRSLCLLLSPPKSFRETGPPVAWAGRQQCG